MEAAVIDALKKEDLSRIRFNNPVINEIKINASNR